MKYIVTSGCIGCGLCASTCPDVFEIGSDGLAYAKDIDTDEEAAVIAKESCPVGVIQNQ